MPYRNSGSGGRQCPNATILVMASNFDAPQILPGLSWTAIEKELYA
jgi:hypothetical protein